MKLRSGVAFCLMIVMLAAAVGIGAYRGWSGEREQVEQYRTGLENMLHTRVESAYNLLTVAKRHLDAGDALLLAVEKEKDTLERNGSLDQKAAAHQAFTRDGKEILQKLLTCPSVQADARDLMYVKDYLPQMLSESESRTESALYNGAARKFNEELGGFSGFLAGLMGIGPAEEFAENDPER